ncbi:hypothetical protein [Tabrizicola aquatica]|uniref:hypothetical protein n=1 Tax=Tabrizicola aquatica TaxID=909926 RepID=UPI000CD28557|nr:hypothetical protein [Tabrizicola aquatica]
MTRHALLLALLANPAAAQDPAVVQPLIDYNAQICQAQGGTLAVGDDAIVPVYFFGPEEPAYMLDGSKLSCSTAPNLYCGEGIGCELTLFVGVDRHGMIVLDWELVPDDDRQLLQVTIAGELINKPSAGIFRATWDLGTRSLVMVD